MFLYGGPWENRTLTWGLQSHRAPIITNSPYNWLLISLYAISQGEIGLGGKNRTCATCSQSTGDTISLHRDITGSSGWDRTNDILINSQTQLPLCYWGIKLAPRRRIELLSSDGQSDIMAVILTGHKFGGAGWSRTNNARGRRIYSPLGLPIFLQLHVFGRGTENRTLINRLKAYYFSR